MLILKILLQFLAVGIALLVNRLDYVTHDKRTRKFKIGRRLLFFLSILFLVVSIIVVIIDESAKNREIESITNQLATLRQQLESAQKTITGGDNFCYVNLVSDGTGENLPLLIAINDGDYPLYDISLRIWDPADYGESAKSIKTLEEFNKLAHNFEVGNLSPHTVRILGRFPLPDSDSKNYEMTVIAKNGVFTQQMRLRRINGAWKKAYRVYKGRERVAHNIFLERADSDFPHDSSGQIQW